ncbi:serine hydrolase [Lacticaseibacillus zhaodongensis]|uniref:serine hydrolase n=1 Tax=Lacticaseibacillus zhaodongensis TaxID=2668065 RepID=UPI0012D337B1|nr:serine hydrolase [Lacticaseibacillus zhaodongensis]
MKTALLLADLHRLFADVDPASYALYVHSSTGYTYGQAEHTPMPAASLIKLAIAAYIETQVQLDESLLQRQLTVPADPVAGAGVTYHLSQRTWAVQDLVDLMLSVSDNNASNMLLAEFGLQNVAAWAAIHYPDAILHRRLMHPEDGPKQNIITAAGAEALLAHFFSADTPYQRLVRRALAAQTNRGKLLALADEDDPTLRTYAKSGELSDCEHDCARFERGDEWIDCALLLHFSDNKQQVLTLQQSVGAAILVSLDD